MRRVATWGLPHCRRCSPPKQCTVVGCRRVPHLRCDTSSRRPQRPPLRRRVATTQRVRHSTQSMSYVISMLRRAGIPALLALLRPLPWCPSQAASANHEDPSACVTIAVRHARATLAPLLRAACRCQTPPLQRPRLLWWEAAAQQVAAQVMAVQSAPPTFLVRSAPPSADTAHRRHRPFAPSRDAGARHPRPFPPCELGTLPPGSPRTRRGTRAACDGRPWCAATTRTSAQCTRASTCASRFASPCAGSGPMRRDHLPVHK